MANSATIPAMLAFSYAIIAGMEDMKHMVENNDAAIRPHDWLEADRMVDETLLRQRDDFLDMKCRFHRGIGRMIDGNMPFTDDNFREMLENVFFPSDIPFLFDDGGREPRGIPSLLSEDMNDHPIERFQELLSCMRMHLMSSGTQMRMVWHAHELMERHHIAEYDDREAGTSLNFIVRDAGSDDEIILKTKIFDVIMQSCGDDIDLRNRMLRLAFPLGLPMNENVAAPMLTAFRSYFTNEPDYKAALSILDDFMAGMEPNREIDLAMFRRLLKSCDGNPNAMSGFMHAAIEFDRITDQYYEYLEEFFSSNENTDDFIYPNAMRLMLANLAEGYPIEYIIELIISDGVKA